MAQLTYNQYMGTAYPGLLGEAAGGPKRIDSFNNPDDEIGFGLAVAKIVGDEDGVKPVDSNTDKILGVSRFTAQQDTGNYPVKSTVAVVRQGSIYVQTEGTLDADSPVFVRFRTEPHVIALTFSGALVTGNTINGTVNSVAIAAVPFNTDNATTLNDIATAIAALDSVASAVSNGTNIITVTGAVDGEALLAALTVTGGASQATVTQATVTGPSSGNVLGAFLGSDDDQGTGASAVALSGAQYMGNPDANGVALIEINLP